MHHHHIIKRSSGPLQVLRFGKYNLNNMSHVKLSHYLFMKNEA